MRSADGSVPYSPDTDDQVAKEALLLRRGGRIGEGERLRVSAYQSARNMTAMWATPASACNKEFFKIQRDYYANFNALFNTPSKYFLYYDEIRVLNWDPACADVTAGKFLADMTKTVQADLLARHPALERYIWNDMYDPTMNAVEKYWLARGSMAGAVDGLQPKTVVVNWTDSTDAKRIESLKYFGDRAMRQMIAGYYDKTDLSDIDRWRDVLNTAESNGLRGVQGFMYTTWHANEGYGQLEAVAEHIKSKSKRWPQ
ncbi:hypothetical protein [Rugamonas rubra]|uniref:Glycosyl hydrolase-like 10 domain-containing protein n=1 Tax=Rugamonas rubra TaxID=758825 RepID=A0A1I4MRI8_9BURK|nr:hypothetical protein [Rugamonas rubra]SFM05697.1 hypothetical protein SAMN02982985_02574 [Rugamonas rubra]